MPSRTEERTGEHADKRTDERAAGLVLAAGGSSRLGRPKQLLPYGDGVLLDAVLRVAAQSGLDQVVVALGGSEAEVKRTVDLAGVDIADNPDFTAGCSSSIAAAIPALHPATRVLILLLGDQPGVRAETVRTLIAGRADAPIAVCRYDDGVGHPFAFDRSVLPALAALEGDKAVWKLLEQRAAEVTEVRIPGPIPIDVDTEDDYARVLAELREAG
ncbi:nucleotidyltransferase family protein [Leifsonia sp. McL0607]|uniref:nucleotidyltransferase family protein n=1 Tax=Leifsonia sp. McL0607 TaxID=3415672 RepID=UPI003CEE5168